jgi:hypothetical protein
MRLRKYMTATCEIAFLDVPLYKIRPLEITLAYLGT